MSKKYFRGSSAKYFIGLIVLFVVIAGGLTVVRSGGLLSLVDTSKNLAQIGSIIECSLWADTDRNCRISQAEMNAATIRVQAGEFTSTQLVRVAQFFNLCGYKVQAGTEDGFAPVGCASLTISPASSSTVRPYSSTRTVSTTTGALKVPMLYLGLKSTLGDSKLKSINFSVTSAPNKRPAYPSKIYLYVFSSGSSILLGQASGASASLNNLNLIIPKDTSKTLLIKADFPATTVSGSAARARVETNTIAYETPSGTVVRPPSRLIFGNDINFSSPTSITVLSPNGGERWAINSGQYPVGYRHSGLSGNQAKISIFKPGQGTYCLLDYTTISDTGLAYVRLDNGCLNASEYGSITPGSYKVNIFVSGLFVRDSSDAVFTIVD